MEVLKELHVSIAETCEASFSTAYRRLESKIGSLQKRTAEAEENAAVASAARQATEDRNEELQSHVAALQEQLRQFEAQNKDPEIPNNLKNLEDEFAPELVRPTGHSNVKLSKDALMNKYSALYANLQTLTQSWASLKAKVMQHKKTLRHYEKQLGRNEFTLVLEGAPVTFRRTRLNSPSNLAPHENIMNRTTSDPSVSVSTNVSNAETQDSLTDTPVRVKTEDQSQRMDLATHPEAPTLTQGQSGVDQATPEESLDTLYPLPDMKTLKRKRVSSNNSSKPTETTPKQPVRIKNEPISSSPARSSIDYTGQHFPSTQDLDAIGQSVKTPTKRKSQRDIHHEHQGYEDDNHPLETLQEPKNKKQKIRGQRNPLSHGAVETSRPNHRFAGSAANRQASLEADDMESQSCPEVRPEDEPYRARPLHRLDLSHFKINPAGNQGMDYAYSTVVRKKEDRKCLSGCMRSDCCGDRFRAMARLEISSNNSPEQKRENKRILEEYLGEEKLRLDELSEENRTRLLVEAKARVISNQYGKHRHTHQRARTPPGFWRTEMPDTQELEADWEAAGQYERDKVEERYREAMRPGGLWTWADE